MQGHRRRLPKEEHVVRDVLAGAVMWRCSAGGGTLLLRVSKAEGAELQAQADEKSGG